MTCTNTDGLGVQMAIFTTTNFSSDRMSENRVGSHRGISFSRLENEVVEITNDLATAIYSVKDYLTTGNIGVYQSLGTDTKKRGIVTYVGSEFGPLTGRFLSGQFVATFVGLVIVIMTTVTL